jgi:hypothetical protein
MEYETTMEFLRNPAVIYSTATLGALTIGYLIGKVRHGNRGVSTLVSVTNEHDAEIARINANKDVEIKTLEVQKYELECSNTIVREEKLRNIKAEDRQYADKKYENERMTRLQEKVIIAEKLAELKPVIESYLANLSGNTIDSEYLGKRRTFRAELVEEVLEHHRDNDGLAYDIVEGNNVMDEDTLSSINEVIDAKYPLDEENIPQMPREIRTLSELLRSN